MTAGFYFRHFAGFLIQFGLCIVLCLLPFGEGASSYPTRRVAGGCAILALASSALFPIVIGLEFLQHYTWQTLAANLYMLAALLLFVWKYLRILRAVEAVKKLVVLVLALLYAAAQYLLVNLALSLLPDAVLPEVYPPVTLALYALTAAVMFPPFAVLMRRAVGAYLAEMEVENIRREFGILLTVTFLYLAILMLYASIPAGMLAVFWWMVVPPLLLVTAVLGLFYWTLFQESARRKRDSDARRVMEIQKLQYENITHEMEQTRKMRHDMRHLLNHLGELVEQGDGEAVRDYLSDMTERVNHRDTEDYCKNETVNGLLQYYVSMAADNGIQCRVRAVCGAVAITPADLTILLGNAMENAIRACGQMADNRWITVEIGVISGSLLMQIANPCREVYPSGKYPMDGSFLPASAYLSGRHGGGYGLSSLAHTAEKYGGEAQFAYDGQSKVFTARIRLGLNQSEA